MYIIRMLGEKGQIVIPKDIREYFDLKRGSRLLFEVRNDEIIIRPQKDEEFAEEFCSIIKEKLTKKIDIKRLYHDQIEGRNIL
jgi:looped-hinge helix DNA binding domain, AbrB family